MDKGQRFLKKVKGFWKKAAIITAVGIVYPLWLWRGTGMAPGLLAANICSIVGMLFFIYGVFGVLHNVHAMAAFSYSFRYVAHMVRNLKNRDAITGKEVISYAEYVQSYERWEDVPVAFAFGAVAFVLFLLIWKVF